MYATSFTETGQTEIPTISNLAMCDDTDAANCSQKVCYIAVTVEWKTKEKRKCYFSSSSATASCTLYSCHYFMSVALRSHKQQFDINVVFSVLCYVYMKYCCWLI